MSCYVNPPDSTKEQWLSQNGRATHVGECKITLEELPVCLVVNPAFSAAGIAYSHNLLRSMADPEDIREKTWYMVPRDKLYEVSNLEETER